MTIRHLAVCTIFKMVDSENILNYIFLSSLISSWLWIGYAKSQYLHILETFVSSSILVS